MKLADSSIGENRLKNRNQAILRQVKIDLKAEIAVH